MEPEKPSHHQTVIQSARGPDRPKPALAALSALSAGLEFNPMIDVSTFGADFSFPRPKPQRGHFFLSQQRLVEASFAERRDF